MSPLKTTFIGALMAVIPLALKAQTSAQVFNTNKDSITNVMNTAVVNDNTDPENTFPTGGYDTETGKYTSGVVTDRHSNRYAENYSLGFKGVSLSLVAGTDDIDYAISVGNSIKDGLAKAGIPCQFFIKENGTKGFIGLVYTDGEPSAIAKTEERLYAFVRSSAMQYKNYYATTASLNGTQP